MEIRLSQDCAGAFLSPNGAAPMDLTHCGVGTLHEGVLPAAPLLPALWPQVVVLTPVPQVAGRSLTPLGSVPAPEPALVQLLMEVLVRCSWMLSPSAACGQLSASVSAHQPAPGDGCPCPMTPRGPVRSRALGSRGWGVAGVRGPVAPAPPSGSGWLSQDALWDETFALSLTVRAPGLIPALALLVLTR